MELLAITTKQDTNWIGTLIMSAAVAALILGILALYGTRRK